MNTTNLIEKSVTMETTAIFSNSLLPSETALKKAVLSAQFVGEKAEFSMLHPVYTFPEVVNNAAPTQKPEYGA